MTRLYEKKYNKAQWKYVDIDEIEHYLINKYDHTSYHIIGKVIGFEQIDTDTFLIHRQFVNDIYTIGRFKLTSNKLTIEFSINFKKFTFLTDDAILFDNTFVYSISQNSEIPESKWLKNKKVEIITDNISGKSILFVEVCISPFKEYVQTLADIRSFKAFSKAYSTLRDSYITLTDSFTFDDLINEDVHYDSIVQDYFCGVYDGLRAKGQQTLLKEYIKKI